MIVRRYIERGDGMDNSTLITNAIRLLDEVNSKDTESVEISTSTYDDDSKMLTINVAFFAPEDKTTEGK